MVRNVKITSEGIKTVLKRMRYSQKQFFKSIAEYVWNGFDAKATEVQVNIEIDKIGILRKISIKDNGTGINHEELAHKFDPFFETDKIQQKKLENHTSTYHGKNGVGRLTFFTFAHFAKWETVYLDNDKCFKYQIDIKADELHKYQGLDNTPTETKEDCGTIVSFSGFLNYLNDRVIVEEVLAYFKLEFAWYLELNKSKKYKLVFNGKDIDYSDIVGDTQDFTIKCGTPEELFSVRYVQWKQKINEEYSRFYYLDSKNNERYNNHTSLNKQGDDFYHSLYISSEYFNKFNFISDESSNQKALDGGVKSDETYRKLHEELYEFLRKKRKPFLKEHSKKLIEDLENENIIVTQSKSELELIQTIELKSVVKGLYEIQPKIFSDLNNEQKKTFIGMLQLIINSEERTRIIELMEKIVNLDSEERRELTELLKVTSLNSIIKTMSVIKHRYEVLEILKKINFDKTFKANEVDHLQKVIECNTWTFGEQYHLVAAAEDTFDTALREHRKLIYYEDKTDSLTHPDKNKQVDIFICRQQQRQNKIHNIIIELKHPEKKLGEKEVSQIKKYFRVILQESRFNANNYTWDYILVGSSFDSTGYIEEELKNAQKYGEDGLIFNPGNNHRIFVRKWSDVLIDCELRHNFLNQHLDIQKEKLAKQIKDANDAVSKAQQGNQDIKKKV
jgi:hypothetical protein